MSPILKRILQLLFLVLVQAAILFLSAGTIYWLAGWVYLVLYVLLLAVASIVMIPSRKEVIEERSKGLQGGKGWDLWITRLMIIPTIGLLIVSGLNVRFSWTPPFPLWVNISGVVLFIAGYALALWAMYANQYFSQVVRIQTERGHTTVSDGPYRIIRHPGYLGMTLSMLGSVLILNAFYGFACFILYLILVITRTAFEDRTLYGELTGYPEYTAQTKYRLFPGIW